MSLEYCVIFAFCLLIILLIKQHLAHIRIQLQQQKNEKLIQLLQACPVHEYTMPHMLERSLAMLFALPQFNLIPKGAVFLLVDKKLTLSAQRGLTELINDFQKELSINSCLCNVIVETDQFQLVSCSNNKLKQPAHDHFMFL